MHTHVTHSATQLISVSFSEVQELSIGDKTQMILEAALKLEVFTPKDLVDAGICRDSKDAWWWVNRLAKRYGVFRKIRYRFYTVVRDAALKLLQRPVKRISEGIRRSKANGGSRTVMGTRSFVAVSGFPGYGGLWIDNGRYYVSGVLRSIRQGRGVLWSLGVFGEACRVVYFEVAHAVTNVVLDGVVVVYSNAEDFSRFGCGCVRVEWRPPSGFVRRGGVSGVFRRSLDEFVKAFMSLWVVLLENLGWRRVVGLFRWLVFELRRRGFGWVLDGVCVG
jgi:hypothetical protein